MRRRSDDSPRETVSIFSLSFLDVFACCLGALILILMMVINQVTLAFDPTAVQAEVQELESQKKSTATVLPEMMAAQSAAREWDNTKEDATREIAALQQEIAQMQSVTLEFADVTTEIVNQARQVVVQARTMVEHERENAGTLWFGTGDTGRKPRFLDVHDGHIIDHPVGGERRTLSLSDLTSFLRSDLDSGEYPVFIIRPQATEFWDDVESRVESTGVLYGFEPYTSTWEPILGGANS